MHDELAKVDWSQVPTTTLVALLRRFVWVLAGVQYLAERSPRATAEAEFLQFYDLLMVRGIIIEEAGDQLGDGEDALDIARFAAIGHLTIHHVAQELVRLGKGHKPGVAAAILLGLPGKPESPELDEAQGWAQGYMIRRIKWVYPQTVLAHGDPAYAEEADPDLPYHVAKTLSEPRWSDKDVLLRIVDALVGRMDVAPHAIRDRLARAQKLPREKRELEFQFAEKTDEDGEPEVIEPADRSADSAAGVTDRELNHEIAELGEKYPRLLPYLTARRRGDNQKAAASVAGISDRTARTYDTAVKDIVGRRKSGRSATETRSCAAPRISGFPVSAFPIFLALHR